MRSYAHPRRGGPYALLTNMAPLDFDRKSGRFRPRSVHHGSCAADVCDHTGFDYDTPADVPATPIPDGSTLALLRGRVLDELAETYPAFARSMAEAA